MNRDDAIELVHDAMDNKSDYDTSLHIYAAAAVDALGWHDITQSLPDYNQVVVCTDGEHRWLDMRMAFRPDMKWQGHAPTYWHPILEVPSAAVANHRTTK